MTHSDFEYHSLPVRVHFGAGKARLLPETLQHFSKTFAIGSPRVKPHIDELSRQLGPERVFHFDEVVQHVPQLLVDKAQRALAASGAEALLAIGGGSAIGLAKALALGNGLPIVAVPTTYSGSEMTNIWGISTEEGKTTGRDERVLPADVLYDPELSLGMPLSLAATSAMNAMAHLMEATYAHDGNPVTYHNSLLGMARLSEGIKMLAEAQQLSHKSNELILFGAFLAGKGLCEVSMALHHKAAHVLGGSFGMEHSRVHTVLQAYVLEYQWPGLTEHIRADLQRALSDDYPPHQLRQLAAALGAPTSLREIGFREEDIPGAVEAMLANPYPNPVPLEHVRLGNMLANAYKGELAGSRGRE